MPKQCTTNFDDFSAYSTGTPPASADTDSNSDSSFIRSRLNSLIGFHRWIADEKLHHTTESSLGVAAAVGSGEATRKTYIMEDISSASPVRRWRNLVDDDEPQTTKKCRRGCGNTCRRRTRSSSREVYVSPKYIEPWIWKGTTRNPRRFRPSSVNSDDGGGGGGGGSGGESNTLKFFLVFIVIIACLILLVKNKDRMQDLVKFGGRYLASSDFSDVKVRVEGGVKDMIGSNFDDMSWKYHEDPRELEEDEQSFESAVEQNDPSVLKHIRSFEEQLKKKPSQFFPGRGGSGGGGAIGAGNGGRNKSSQFWSSVLN